MTFFFKHARSLMAGLAVGVLSSAATPVLCGTINYSMLNPNMTPDPTGYTDLQTNLLSASPYVQMLNVTETWDDPQLDPVLTPPVPTAEATSTGLKVNFTPSGYTQVQTGTADPIQIIGKNSTFSTRISAAGSSSDPNIARYAIQSVNMNITGASSVWAPFPAPLFSFAQATATASYNITLKSINGQTVQDVSFGSTVPLTLVSGTVTSVVPGVSVWQQGPAAIPPAQDPAGYTWYSNLLLTQNDLRNGFGISDPNKYITEISLSFVSSISVGSLNAQASSSIGSFSAGVDTLAVPVPVPEPPTIILAGLGAVAVVANGYRRRKQRGQGGNEAGSEGQDVGDLNGAIALTA